MMKIIDNIAERHTHHLRCKECGSEMDMGDARGYLMNGWPKCCKKTMELMPKSSAS